VLAIEVRRRPIADKELTAVGVRAAVGHGEHATVRVGQPDALVLEFRAVDGLATGAVASGSVSTLHHEAFYDAMELVVFEGRSV